MTNLDLVKQAYSNFSTGNVPGVLALFDTAIEWRECKGMPFVNGDGIFIGPEAVLTNVFMSLPVYIDGLTSEPLIAIAIPVTNVFGDFQGVTAVLRF